ncbi:MAG: hypothetical protein K8I00_08385 [Candidatus Omnitrophica bacterium]|nr:hypothetical protein [Candidatus Omnitrophota bacterium]
MGVYCGNPNPANAGAYLLQDVIDYRTITVLAPSGELETVRLIGMEVREPGLQSQADQYLKSILRDAESLRLEIDQQERDSEHRLLAYVWSVHRRNARWLAVNRVNLHFDRAGLNTYWDTDGDDGREYRCLNAELMSSGYVRAVANPPNIKYQHILQVLMRQVDDRRGQQDIAERPADLPRNLEECYAALTRELSPQELVQFMQAPEQDVVRYRIGLGFWLRNRWGLWQNSELKQYFSEMGITDPDEMSQIILTSFHRHLNKKDIQLQQQIRLIQQYLKQQ